MFPSGCRQRSKASITVVFPVAKDTSGWKWSRKSSFSNNPTQSRTVFPKLRKPIKWNILPEVGGSHDPPRKNGAARMVCEFACQNRYICKHTKFGAIFSPLRRRLEMPARSRESADFLRFCLNNLPSEALQFRWARTDSREGLVSRF